MGRQFGNKRGRRHAWLSVDLKTDKFPRSFGPIVETKIGPADAPAAQRVVRVQCQFLDSLVNIR